jgi:hypothetical protein
MGEKFELSYLDLCRLSQAFNRDANLAEPGDYRINEWLKQEIACRTIQGGACVSRGPALDPWTIGNKQMTTSVLQDHSTACDGRGPRQAQSDIQVRWTHGRARGEARGRRVLG